MAIISFFGATKMDYTHVKYSMERDSVICGFDGNCRSIPNTTTLEFSNHFLAGIENVVPEMPDDAYIICPTYLDRRDKISLSDTQISFTGKLKYDEQNIHGMIRELAEESGLDARQNIKMKPLTIQNGFIDNGKDGIHYHASTYMINVNNLVPLLYTKTHARSKDDKTRRVQSVLYGSFDEVRGLLGEIKFRGDKLCNDNIGSLRAISAHDFKNIYELIKR